MIIIEYLSQQAFLSYILIYIYFFLMDAPVANEISQARDSIQVTAVTYITAAATLDPLPHCTAWD